MGGTDSDGTVGGKIAGQKFMEWQNDDPFFSEDKLIA